MVGKTHHILKEDAEVSVSLISSEHKSHTTQGLGGGALRAQRGVCTYCNKYKLGTSYPEGDAIVVGEEAAE